MPGDRLLGNLNLYVGIVLPMNLKSGKSINIGPNMDTIKATFAHNLEFWLFLYIVPIESKQNRCLTKTPRGLFSAKNFTFTLNKADL